MKRPRGQRGQRKRKPVESEDEEEKAERAERAANKRQKADAEAAFTSKLVVPDWSKLQPFVKSTWTGPAGEAEPSDALKQTRKDIGVVVKGNLAGCPPPVHAVDDALLPALMKDYFAAHNLATPTSIQQQAWPAILAGCNVLAIAPTGSGKTIAYALPLAHLVLAQPPKTKQVVSVQPQCLILLPTRELVIQVHSVLRALRRLVPQLQAGLLYGGQSKQDQLEKLTSSGGVQMLVATPGRLLDVLQCEDTANLLRAVHCVVVDEADRMLSLGFREQLDSILSVVRPDRQTVLFTATFPSRLREVGELWAPNPAVLRCAAISIQDTSRSAGPVEDRADSNMPVTEEEEQPALTEDREVTSSRLSSVTISPQIKQHIHICAAHKRPRLLLKYLERITKQDEEQKKRQRSGVIIFCNTIKAIKFVEQLLGKQAQGGSNYGNENGTSKKTGKQGANNGYKVTCLHGQMPQQRREEQLLAFRSGKVNILIATDVAARGLHIKRINYVINYDFPGSIEQYCHRIGRTGRDSAGGEDSVAEAYSLFTRNFSPLAKELMHLMLHCGQIVEKNLRELVEEIEQRGSSGGDGDVEGEGGDEEDEDEGDQGEEDDGEEDEEEEEEQDEQE